jgi:predicted nucleic acid-binding protein
VKTVTDKVVDASAVAAVIFFEPRRGEVEKALSGANLHAPALIRYELATVCLKKIRERPSERTAILAAFGALDSFEIQEIQTAFEQAIQVAEDGRLSLYDASYLWLARSMNVDLVTLDEKLKRAARGFLR